MHSSKRPEDSKESEQQEYYPREINQRGLLVTATIFAGLIGSMLFYFLY